MNLIGDDLEYQISYYSQQKILHSGKVQKRIKTVLQILDNWLLKTSIYMKKDYININWQDFNRNHKHLVCKKQDNQYLNHEYGVYIYIYILVDTAKNHQWVIPRKIRQNG